MAATAQAKLSDTEALIAHLQLMVEKLKREKYGQRSERTARLIEQMELQLEDLVTAASEDELAAAAAAAKAQSVRAFTRKRPVRKPWPEDIERERVVIAPANVCTCCGGSRLSKLGEDVTETLEEIPRRFKLIETVREKFTCRDCGKVSQLPAPFHATPRGFIGPKLLATILFDKFGMHVPLNRQSTRFKAEGIDLPLSILADQVGHGTFAAMPLFRLMENHVLAAERLHGDDTTIRILAKGKCVTGRIWTYLRDDRPFAGPAPPAAVYYASSDRRGEHPQKHLPASFNRSRRRFASPMRGAASSSWPISRKMPGTARGASRSPRSRWRRSGGSTHCSRSSGPSMAAALTSGGPCARRGANHFSTTCAHGCSASAKPSRALPRS